jgi:uncharacterized protein YjbI with pentapeptide repeats
MATCSHLYGHDHGNCPQPAAGGSGVCLWHNSSVRKSDDYVPALLLQADRLANGDLAEFHLAGLMYPRANLPLRNLRHADIKDAILDGADLGGADLSGASLRRSSLKQADLHGARLAGCDLTGVNLSGADLRGADLSGAILSGTSLLGTDLRGANLKGAQVADFQWNRLTRFAGVTGLEASRTITDQDQTQGFLAPLAMGGNEESGELSALAETDPAALKTRVFSPLPPSASTVVAPPPLIKPVHVAGRRQWPVLVAAAAAVIMAGVAGTLVGQSRGQRVATPMVAATANDQAAEIQRLEQERTGLSRQHEADLGEIRRIQGHEREHDDSVAVVKQEAAVQRAEAEQLRTALHEAENDVLRLRGADDKATVMAVKLTEAQQLAHDLAHQISRQDELSRILADGVSRLQQDNLHLTSERDAHVVDETRAHQFETEATASRGLISGLTKERDDLVGQNQKLLAELLTAQRDIERYLARVNATHLQDYLTESDHKAALIRIVPGKPIAMSGDYLLTLRVDAGSLPGTVLCQVVAQRPPSATNPEITVVLYDQDERPLRRFSYSYPHIDEGRPFVSTSTTVACDRMPSFIRVQVAPGLDDLAAQK